jgi:hypothetical protein
MNLKKNKRIVPLLLSVILVTLLAGPTLSMAAQPSVNLGTTTSYAVLAGSTITNTGPTTINGDAGGDVGLYPGSSFAGSETVTYSGILHIGDAAAQQAKVDLQTAYNDAAGRTPITTIPTELGGTTLKPGVYTSASGTFGLTGTLTLDAEGDPEGVFVFLTASTLITADTSNVVLLNEARYCRTFWKVGSSATLGKNSYFVGHIFAQESITATTGASMQGQLMALTGAVTLDSNTITNGFCETASIPDEDEDNSHATPVPPATLHVIKHVINDNGGTAVASQFNIHVMSSDTNTDVAGSPANGVESPGTTYTLAPGTYTVSEKSFAGDANRANFANYTVSFGGDADASGNITLVSGDSKTIIITNDDIPFVTPAPPVVTPVPPVVSPSTNIPNGGVPQDLTPTQTITGGELPQTATPYYSLLLAGALLLFVGVYGLSTKIR